MYNKIIIIGNLGSAPDMRYMPNGTAVANFNVATSNTWVDKNTGELQKETTWFKISCFGKPAENAGQYLSKGSKVFVEGRLKCDPQTGSPRVYLRNDGTAGASFEINASQIQYLGKVQQQGSEVKNDDDIPF